MFSSISTQSTLYQIFPSSLREISPYLYLTEGNKNVNLSSIVQVEDKMAGGCTEQRIKGEQKELAGK